MSETRVFFAISAVVCAAIALAMITLEWYQLGGFHEQD